MYEPVTKKYIPQLGAKITMKQMARQWFINQFWGEGFIQFIMNYIFTVIYNYNQPTKFAQVWIPEEELKRAKETELGQVDK